MTKKLSKNQLNKKFLKSEKPASDKIDSKFSDSLDYEIASEIGAISNAGMLDKQILSHLSSLEIKGEEKK